MRAWRRRPCAVACWRADSDERSSDDGGARGAASAGSGLGIVGMRERIESLLDRVHLIDTRFEVLKRRQKLPIAARSVAMIAPAPATAGEPSEDQQMLALLERLADSGPVALVIEDAHWADEASVGALAYLARTGAAVVKAGGAVADAGARALPDRSQGAGDDKLRWSKGGIHREQAELRKARQHGRCRRDRRRAARRDGAASDAGNRDRIHAAAHRDTWS